MRLKSYKDKLQVNVLLYFAYILGAKNRLPPPCLPNRLINHYRVEVHIVNLHAYELKYFYQFASRLLI